MTVFPDGRKERLHGHNYYLAVSLDLTDISFANMVDFGPIKAALEALCSEWKEHLLLATSNPRFELVADDGVEIEFRLCSARYVMPRDEVLLLPVDNIAVEALAQLAGARLLETLDPILHQHVVGIEVTVEENPGQGATCYQVI